MVAKLNLLESVLIGLIARKPSAGYDIRKHLEKTGRIYGYVPQASQIYRQLAAMVRRGLLEYTIDRERSGPDAKVYTLTEAGADELLNWTDAPFVPSERPLDAHFQLHFSLLGPLSPVVALRLVEAELAFRVEQEDRWAPDMFPADHAMGFDPDWSEEVAFLGDARGNMLATAHISWLRTTRRRLERYIERTGASWPTQAWLRRAGRL